MKTGRLLKFRRPGGEVHAYLYKEEGQFRAALYLFSGEGEDGPLMPAPTMHTSVSTVSS